jgi:serine/threonine protein kinase
VAKKINREADILAQLTQHPGFPKFYGYGEMADYVYTAMEFIQGTSLEDMIEERGHPLPEADVIEWAIQICDALTHLHNLRPTPFIHRELKPSNVIIDHHGRARLVDFAAAERYQAGREQSGIGAEGYAAPEQYVGYADARSDVYELGATLHHLLTLRDPRVEKPFTFHDAPPRSLNPAISEALEAVILKATEHNPLARYQNMEEMKAALLACQESTQV